MGTFTYDSRLTIEIDDRTLMHLEIVIGSKLRRREAFAFTYVRPRTSGSGRFSVWMSPNVPVAFQYYRTNSALNREWIEALMRSANGPTGLEVLDEPVPHTPE